MGSLHRRSSLLRWQPVIEKITRLWTRREVLRRAGQGAMGLAAAPLLPGCAGQIPGDQGSRRVARAAGVEFRHGVASGDPLPDRVVLWTRVTPLSEITEISVDWLMSRNADLSAPERSGNFTTSAGRDYTVKLDADGLAPYTTYYYQFSVTQADGSVVTSPIGRTRTAALAGEAQRLRVGVVSCSSYTAGYFNAYAAMALHPDIDLVLCLGDYIYEGAGGSGDRTHSPAHEIVTLADYRERHAQYKADPDLQAAHALAPWITVWDDHETTNNSFRAGASNHTEGAEGVWEERMGGAIRAYFEWMPIRDVVEAGKDFDSPDGKGYLPDGNGRIYRTLSYGGLADFIMLDTRLAGRVVQNGTATVTPEQTILGAEQREWLVDELRTRSATWKIVGQQMTFAPLKTVPAPESTGQAGYLNEDAWDGYRFDRNTVMDTIRDGAVQNVVVLSGDIHAAIACDLPIEPSDPTQYNPVTGAGSLAVEMCCNGITNTPIPVWTALMATNPHLKYANETLHGYLVLDITPQRCTGEWYYVPQIQQRSSEEILGATLYTDSGANHLVRGLAPVA